jgi:biotin carboxyl carrier protein
MLKIRINNGEARTVEFLDKNFSRGQINGVNFELDLAGLGKNHFHLIKEGKGFTVEQIHFNAEEKTFIISVNGNKYQASVKDKYDELLKSLGFEGLGSRKVNEMKAPMPGLVLDILAKEGNEVKKGDAILVLEAMKMENILKSPTDGIIKKVSVKKGNAVEKNQVLINFV